MQWSYTAPTFRAQCIGLRIPLLEFWVNIAVGAQATVSVSVNPEGTPGVDLSLIEHKQVPLIVHYCKRMKNYHAGPCILH